MRRYRLHPTLEFSLAHRPEQLFRMCGADQPPVDQRDGVGMERVPADTRDRGVKMRLDAPEQRTPIAMFRIAPPAQCDQARGRKQRTTTPPPPARLGWRNQ